MTLLSILPTDILLSIFNVWVKEARLIVKTETAFCNQTDRVFFLEVLSSPHFNLKYSLEKKQKSFFEWISLRKILLREVDIDYDTMKNLKIRKVLKYMSGVRDLTVKYCTKKHLSPAGLIKIINACPKLEKLRIFDVVSLIDDVIIKIKIPILEQLLDFRITRLYEHCTGEFLRYMSEHTTNLDSLCLYLNYVNFVESDVIELIEANQFLDSIALSSIGPQITDDLFESIADGCKWLSRLSVDSDTTISINKANLASLFNLFKKCVYLDDVDVKFETLSFKFSQDRYGDYSMSFIVLVQNQITD